MSQDNHENTKKKISYFYFSQTLKPKTQRDRNTLPRAQNGTRVKKLVRPHIRATGFTCAAEDTGATPSRSVSHNNAKPSSMPANKHCTHKHRRALWQGEERVCFFSGMGPPCIHATTWRDGWRWAESHRGAESRSVLSESEPEGETLNKQTLQGERKKKGICHSQRQERRCIGDKRPDWQYAQTQATQGSFFYLLSSVIFPPPTPFFFSKSLPETWQLDFGHLLCTAVSGGAWQRSGHGGAKTHWEKGCVPY